MWEKLGLEAVKSIYSSELRKKFFSKQKFLNYDIKWLMNQYPDHRPINELNPYTEAVRWLGKNAEETLKNISEIKLCIDEQTFKLDSNSSDLDAFQGESLAKFKDIGKMTSNEKVIRLDSLKLDKGKTTLNIRPAFYSDQVKSNLVLDWEGPHTLSKQANIKTLRSFFNARYGNSLPPLSDQTLGNTIGVSAIVLYRENKELIPYLPQRIGNKFRDIIRKTGRTDKSIAVFEGGYHCTASGAAEWRECDTFDEMITEDIYCELKEEVGLKKENIELLIPVALCREYLRGGKPQIFFVGITNCSKKELDNLRTEAINTSIQAGEVPEIHDVTYKNISGIDLYNELKNKGITLEALGNLYYVDSFIKAFKLFGDSPPPP